MHHIAKISHDIAIQIAKNIYLFFVYINFFKGHIQNFKLVWPGWYIGNPDSYRSCFGQNNFKGNIFDNIWKKILSAHN